MGLNKNLISTDNRFFFFLQSLVNTQTCNNRLFCYVCYHFLTMVLHIQIIEWKFQVSNAAQMCLLLFKSNENSIIKNMTCNQN